MQLRNILTFLLFYVPLFLTLSGQTIDGELRRWHKVTLTFDGPNLNETSSPNPFSDYRMEVTFTHEGGGSSYKIPGYFAACGNAADNSCTSGNKWRVHFSPSMTGTWNWTASFKSGTDAAINSGGNSAGYFDGNSGNLSIQESNKTGRDNRSANKGRLQYVNKHYLRYSGTDPQNPNGDWFLKAGPDAPENMLSYDDFDGVGNAKKNWQPHQQDYLASDAQEYTWAGGKGSEMLGMVRYLGEIKKVNAFSFLTFSLDGDDRTVSPHLTSSGNGNGWSQVHHDRFDVSKMGQWERIFAYADKKGMYLHFKMQETENNWLMDAGNVGRERKLYYRELIARFGHHLALNWNLGEENTQSTQQQQAMAQYFSDTDPYHHNIVLHTDPSGLDRVYTPLLGNNSKLTGASLQIDIHSTHNIVKKWVNNSANAGRPWVVANDEQGGAGIGVHVDPQDRKLVREEVIWGTFLAGGAGFEFYYGYQSGCSDLDCQNHRTRDAKYTDAAIALTFFQEYFMPYLPDVVNMNGELSNGSAYLLRSTNKAAYAIYLPNGGSTNINGLPAETKNLRWFNPRTGQMGTSSTLNGGNSISAPDGQDWVALLTSDNVPNPNPDPDPDPNPDPDPDPNNLILEEIDGVLAIEAEHFIAQTRTDKRKWYLTNSQTTPGIGPDPDGNHSQGASGSAYLEILPDTRATHADPLIVGENFSNTAGVMALIDYQVYINNPGKYYVFVRAFSTGTEDNGVHVGLDGAWPASGARMQWCAGKNTWAWESLQRTDANHCGEPQMLYLDIDTRGLHTITFSMREDGFEMDKIVLVQAYNKPQNEGPAEVVYGNLTFPVEWLEFKATQRGANKVQLDWTTARETNNAGFQIERSVDRILFEQIGSIGAVGNSTSPQSYSFTDPAAPSSELYYRLKQVDIDGQVSYSAVRTVQMGDSFSANMTVYPNPTKDMLNLKIEADQDKTYEVKLVDMQGRTLYQETYTSGSDDPQISMASYATGMYVIVLIDPVSNQVLSKYFVKE